MGWEGGDAGSVLDSSAAAADAAADTSQCLLMVARAKDSAGVLHSSSSATPTGLPKANRTSSSASSEVPSTVEANSMTKKMDLARGRRSPVLMPMTCALSRVLVR